MNFDVILLLLLSMSFSHLSEVDIFDQPLPSVLVLDEVHVQILLFQIYLSTYLFFESCFSCFHHHPTIYLGPRYSSQNKCKKSVSIIFIVKLFCDYIFQLLR